MTEKTETYYVVQDTEGRFLDRAYSGEWTRQIDRAKRYLVKHSAENALTPGSVVRTLTLTVT